MGKPARVFPIRLVEQLEGTILLPESGAGEGLALPDEARECRWPWYGSGASGILRLGEIEHHSLALLAALQSAHAWPKSLLGAQMWNRDQSRSGSADGLTVQPEAVSATADRRSPAAAKTFAASLGRSVAVTGELTGSEDLTVDGRLEGSIDLRDHALTIGPNGTVHARIAAQIVTVFGSVVGNITARDTIIRKGASVQGDLVCARLAVQDGAHFCGKVDMATRGQTAHEGHTELATPALAEVV
jgi:cytoskeletal protein CcmA (bactofilin family)